MLSSLPHKFPAASHIGLNMNTNCRVPLIEELKIKKAKLF